MPFLALPVNPSLLRFHPDSVILHYLLSTPSHPTFVHARTSSTLLASSLLPTSPLTPTSHRPPQNAVQLDPRYPILLFLPSECFSVAHLFASQLADPTLSSRFNLLALDPRGHGLTKDVPIPAEGGKYDLDIKAADCLDFLRLLLGGKEHWERGIHVVACSMSGLVAARMAAVWKGGFESVVITSPILEAESGFMIESFQGIKELLEESWQSVHRGESEQQPGSRTGEQLGTQLGQRRPSHPPIKLPGEVVQGFTYRWAGSLESIPQHISSYLSRTWLDRLVLHPQGLEAARDWWFDLYWLRSAIPAKVLEKVRCRVLVVEGDTDLPYERKVGEEVAGLFVGAKERKVVTVEKAPILLSVMRGEELTRILCDFLPHEGVPAVEENERGGMEALCNLEPEERFELVKVYAPDLVADLDDDDDDDDTEESNDEGDVPTSPIKLRLHNLPSGTMFSAGGGLTTTRTKRTGSASSTGDRYPLSMRRSPSEGAEGVLVRTLQETNLR
ncbi:hypothetical protein PSEUBRA_003564 [Kalmanozyma brasiliensis GHG001]|uniref:AB hydrolase-1 domain-containing protein n=1 Tax=Kalmanozyma brasiliensis (strain GHG001) TaxID=1365824 RepID=V5EP95_KALBG|nr:uncharacterized protein PSEUBRA_003564 [Kalmanozyma brasiliensis GHG001]EST06935.1 hypothetical protein PSEUBRA_003564 [Kalmanozyma brasiliensis GHG001]